MFIIVVVVIVDFVVVYFVDSVQKLLDTSLYTKKQFVAYEPLSFHYMSTVNITQNVQAVICLTP